MLTTTTAYENALRWVANTISDHIRRFRRRYPVFSDPSDEALFEKALLAIKEELEARAES